jgi:predicted secreted Zn-dependent protease
VNSLQVLITILAAVAIGAAAVAVFAFSGDDAPKQAQVEPTVVVPASPLSTATEAPPLPTPAGAGTSESLPDRTSCDEIRGTPYRSLSERAFYLDTCNVEPTAVVVQQPISSPPSVTADTSAACETDVEITTARGDVTYDVAGANLDEIADSLSANAPQVEGGTAYGLTEYSYSLDGSFCSTGGSCSLGEITLDADVVVTLPNLTTFDLLDGETAQIWIDYEEQVAIHEGRHVRILEDGLAEIKRQLLLIGEEHDCDTLNHEIDKVWIFGGGQIETRQRAFHAADAQGRGGLVVQ